MFKDLLFTSMPLTGTQHFTTPLWDMTDTLATTMDSHLDKAFNSMDKWFDDTLKLTKAAVSLPFNLYKTSTDGEYVYEIAVAGYEPEKISIYHTGNQLRITYESDAESYPTYLYHGIRGRDLDMTFTVPVEAEVTSQKIKNGILSITVQVKKPETKKGKKLKISVE